MSKIILLFVLVAMACSVSAQFQGFNPFNGPGGFNPYEWVANQGFRMPSPSNIEKGGPGSVGSYASSSMRRNSDGTVERTGEVITNNNGEVTKLKY